MPILTAARPRWSDGRACIVAATGPSLTAGAAAACRGERIIAVNDAWQLLPDAEILYGCDAAWWDAHAGAPGFAGERWSSHDDKRDAAQAAAQRRWGLTLIAGAHRDGFSADPATIHYGGNSGFQAINLAILFGARRILLAGFDMRVNGHRHFFGDHPAPLNNNADYRMFIPAFGRAAQTLPPGIEILNCTPGSALDCFPMVDFHDALAASA